MNLTFTHVIVISSLQLHFTFTHIFDIKIPSLRDRNSWILRLYKYSISKFLLRKMSKKSQVIQIMVLVLVLASVVQIQAMRPLEKFDKIFIQSLPRGPVKSSSKNPCTYIPGTKNSRRCTLAVDHDMQIQGSDHNWFILDSDYLALVMFFNFLYQ